MTLSATDLTCIRNGHALFAPVSFTVTPGTAMRLQGPNGIGKTTLLRAIAGLGQPPQGTLHLDGRQIGETEGAFAYSGHLDAIKPALTVMENLSFWTAVYGAGDLQDTLARFALTPLKTRPAGRLSAGQKRRLGLARLALGRARLWLMDEPTVSLDQVSIAALGAVLSSHLSAGGAALIATHLPLPIEATALTLTAAKPTKTADPFLAESAL